MSIDAVSVRPSRRAAQAKTRHEDPVNPARGVMIGLGLSALIWSSIGALLLR